MEGPRCDQCRLGTFSLDASNPKGCTKCFCFGATDRCRSAEKHRAEVRGAKGHQSLRFSCVPIRLAPCCPRSLSCVNPVRNTVRSVIFVSLCPSPTFSPFSWSPGSHRVESRGVGGLRQAGGRGGAQLSSGFIRMHVRS